MPNSQFDYLPHPETEALIAGDLEPNLPANVREVLLDVVLAWANLDMATAFFVASVSGLNPDEGADRFGRKEIADKLTRAAKALEKRGDASIVREVREVARVYPDKALYRRRIAHSKCAGVRKSNPSRLVFMPFEREGPQRHLAIEVFDLSLFAEAAAWARRVHDRFMEIVDRSGFFEDR